MLPIADQTAGPIADWTDFFWTLMGDRGVL